MTTSPQNPQLVQAVYSFKGKNNDELCFKKGDVITVTQKEDGGWWEGTLAGVTGWFPSNYTKECKGLITDANSKTSPVKLPDLTAQQRGYRNLVLKDLIDSEKAHVAELQTLVTNFLHPLDKSELLSRDEYRQLVCNLDAVVVSHSKLLAALELASEAQQAEQRVGKIFLSSAPHFKQIHITYCSSHPRAVCILNKYKDALNGFMEAQGAACPGLLVLTTGLSKPFRRLEKYSGILQELERHMEESHPDRGDTQRSVAVYKDIWSACSARRRQKEQELEVLTGGVRGWEGEDLSTLGEILHMGSVAVGVDHRDRYLVLFPATLLVLSVSTRMSGFIYEGKLPLSGIAATALPDTDHSKNAFEITGPLIERIVAICQTRDEQQAWVEHLEAAIAALGSGRKSHALSAAPPLHLAVTRVSSGACTNSTGPCQPPAKPDATDASPWTVTKLKPLSPTRPSFVCNAKNAKTKSLVSPKKSIDNNFEEDIQILRVIEAYCSSARNRCTLNSGIIIGTPVSTKLKTLPSLNSLSTKEKYVVDSIDLLRSQMTDLSSKVGVLSTKLDEEIKTRRVLQTSVELQLAQVNSKEGE